MKNCKNMHKKIIFAKIFIYLQVPALAERLVRCLLSSLFILPFDEKPGNNSENCSSFLKKSLYIEEYKGNFSPTANLLLCAVCMRGNYLKHRSRLFCICVVKCNVCRKVCSRFVKIVYILKNEFQLIPVSIF